MRVVFMGTPDFAAASLQKLIEENYDIAGVFTQPDKPKGRGMEMSFSPVKELALKHDLPVFQPEKMRDGTALQIVRDLNPDILVVVAYGRILPDDILAVPKFGAVNVHGSLLPKYRGAAPIQWAVLNGDKTTGVTTMYFFFNDTATTEIYTEETEIGEFETAGELFDRLMVMGAELLDKTLRDIEAGTAPRTPQDHSRATYVKMLDKSICPIDWNKSPREIVKHIYGLQPWPVATMELEGKSFRVFGAEYTDMKTARAPGAVVKADDIILASVVTSATIRVSREGNGVLCDFSLSADSRRLVEEVSKCYLAAMYKTIDWENRKIVEKATSEMSASLAKHEELAKKAKSNYDDARDAGNELLEKHKNDMEKLRAECEALRRKISEIRLAASKGTNSLVIVQPLSVERAIK